MSRIHSGHKGRAGSHRPYPLTKPEWVTASSEEVVTQAVQLAKSGMGLAMVGQTLRDSYAIPLSRAITGKRLGLLLALQARPACPELPRRLASRGRSRFLAVPVLFLERQAGVPLRSLPSLCLRA